MAPVGGGGVVEAIGGIFGGGRATKVEQLTQIGQAQTQIKYLLQMLENVPIAGEIGMIFDQMGNLQAIVEPVIEYEVPEKFTMDYDILTDAEYADLRDERMAYYREVDAEIASLEAEIALDENQLDTLMMAAAIAEAPASDITIGQGQFLGDASRLEQQRRDTALKILRDKRTDIKEQLTMGDEIAYQAALKCVRTCK